MGKTKCGVQGEDAKGGLVLNCQDSKEEIKVQPQTHDGNTVSMKTPKWVYRSFKQTSIRSPVSFQINMKRDKFILRLILIVSLIQSTVADAGISFRTTSGPIRSMLGMCIDVPAANFVSGVQLWIYSCNGTPAQYWTRPSSTDLRLQTSNNLCMDASGNVGAGGSIVLSVCNNALDSQKWIYDGRHLRPNYNTGLCLSIEGTGTISGTKLVLANCNTSSEKTVWVEYSMSNVAGRIVSGYPLNTYLCPVGSRVDLIQGNGGSWVDSITMYCSDYYSTRLGPVYGSSSKGSTVTSPSCSAGFIAVSIVNGTWLGKVAVRCSGSSTITSIGAATNMGTTSTMDFNFDGDRRVIGMAVAAERYPTAMGVLYASNSYPLIQSPMIFPTMRPTSRPSLATGREIISARYIKLLRELPSTSGENYVHLLGIDVYDTSGVFISNQSYANMSSCSNTSMFGPQYLIDGVHKTFSADGSLRISHTQNIAGSYLALDFGEDVLMSDVVIWNRVDCCSDRIIGVSLLIYNNAGRIVFNESITSVRSVYYWRFGSHQLNDANIQYLAYQWVLDRDGTLANYGHVSQWDTSRVTNMNDVFGYWNPNAGFNGSSWASSFCGDLSEWNTSHVTSMDRMFQSAIAFNSYLSSWNTLRLTSANNIFSGASSYDRSICWYTSKMNSNFTATTFSGSNASFENPACRGFFMLAFNRSVQLFPSPFNGFSTPLSLDGYGTLPTFTMAGQQRFIFRITDTLFPDADYTLDQQVVISFNLLLSLRVGYRHSICFLEQESDLSSCAADNRSCLFCYDLAGSRILKTVDDAYPVLGTMTSYQLKPLDYFSKQSLNKRSISFIAFINDSDGNEALPTSTYSDITWVKLQTLNITSPSYTQLQIKLPNSTAAASVDFFNLTCNKVISPYVISLLKSEVVPRSVMQDGLIINKLEPGIRYSILLQPAYVNGTIIPAQSSNQFFGYGVVTCSCPNSNITEQTGSPAELSVLQRNGFISMTFTDNSVCEEAYAFTRRQQMGTSIFAPNYYFYSTQECGNMLIPGLNYADDLSLSQLDIGSQYTYCAEAIALNYMASVVSIFNPNFVSSQESCRNVTIAWEATIKGVVTSKADTGSIPIENVNVTWTLMNPNNTALSLYCRNPQSMCEGNITTDSSGTYKAVFFVDEPQFSFNRTGSIPILLRFNRSNDLNPTDTFLGNEEKTDITVNGTLVYLKFLQFDRLLYIVDASTVAFAGNIFVRNTEYGSYEGCPVADAEVCAYESKKETGGSSTQKKLACRKTDSDGDFNLPLPVGAIVHNITISYFNHEFAPAVSNVFAMKYQDGIFIDPKNDYSGNNFVDITIAPLNIDVVGGLCNKTLGTAYLMYSILGCSWDGSTLQQSFHLGAHYVPAQVVQIFGITVKDVSNASIAVVNDFFGDKQKTVDLRKYVDPSAAYSNVHSDSTGARLGVEKGPPLFDQTDSTEYIRFQFDGNLKMKFILTSADSIGTQCKQECTHSSSLYFQSCDSLHVISTLSIVQFDVALYYEVLPGLTCDIVQDGAMVIIQNYLGYENIPNFEQSDFYESLPLDERDLIKKCYPSCINNITYTSISDDGQPLAGAGLYNVSLYAGRVQKTRPYIRQLIIKVSAHTSSAEYQEYEHTANFIIQGLYKEGDGMSFAFPTHTPAMILRDPPGGSSFAYYENVKTTMTIDSRTNIDHIDNELSAGLTITSGFSGSTCYGLFAMVCVDNILGQALSLFKISSKVGGRINYWKQDISASRSITWTYQTSTDPWLAGAMSDIFVVPNLNVKYQQVSVVIWQQDLCTVREICDANHSTCRLPMDIVFNVHDTSTKEALAFYSRFHIENVKIPELRIALEVQSQRLQDIIDEELVCGDDYNSLCTETDKNNTLASKAVLDIGIAGWNTTLEQELTLHLQMKSPVKDWGCFQMASVEDIPCLATPIMASYISSNAVLLSIPLSQNITLENINRLEFSGGGNTMSMSMTLDHANESTENGPKPSIDTDLTISGPDLSFSYEIGGNGIEGFMLPLTLTYSHEFTNDVTSGSEFSTSISFQLGDDDSGDEFVVDLFVDKKFGGIIFNTVGGRSQCPHELGTAANEVPYLEVISFPSNKIPIDQDLLFYVDIANFGLGSSDFKLKVLVSQDSDGLEVSIDGVNIGLALEIKSIGSFNNLFPKKYRKLVRIKRGPTQIMHPSLLLSLESSCGDDDNPAVSVDLYNTEDIITGSKYLQWVEKCPTIEWAGSIKFSHGFSVTTQDDMNSLSVSIFNSGHQSSSTASFALKDNSRLQASSTGVYLMYRMVGTPRWNKGMMILNGTTVDADFISDSIAEDTYGYIQLNWAISSAFVQDGTYEITVQVVCDNIWGHPDDFQLSSVFGVIDRSYPTRYGLPSPIDDKVHVGQEISLFFSKPLLCFPIPFNIKIVVGQSLTLRNEQLVIDCHDNKIGFVVDLTKVSMTRLVGKNFTVEIGRIDTNTAAVKDIHGNPTDPNKGNIGFEKSFLPLGKDMQTSFILSASSVNNTLCSICDSSSIASKNCTTGRMRLYQESVIRNKLSSMMTLNVTDRISISSIDCVSKTISGTVTFTDPMKPTIPPTAAPSLMPSQSMKPTVRTSHRPSKQPIARSTSKPTSTKTPTEKPSYKQTIKPTLKPSSPTTRPSKKPMTEPTHTPTRVQFRVTTGLIYNKASGQCLSYNSSSTVVMASCDELNVEQQWYSTKSIPAAFALVSQSNRSLYGGVMASSIILTERNNSAYQLWILNGINQLQSQHNSTLCITHLVTTTIVELLTCSNDRDPYKYNQNWYEFSLFGGSFGSIYSYFICPSGEKVVNITGRAGAWINSLSMMCDGGITLGPIGSLDGGYEVSGTGCLEGYTKLSVTSGTYVGKLSATCVSSPGSISFGLASGSYGSGSIDVIQCQGNERIVGFYSRYGTYVDSINIVCGPVLTNPTTRPTSKPTIGPSKKPTLRPSTRPTAKRTAKPSATKKPTSKPTTTKPTLRPSLKPSTKPTLRPSLIPSKRPTRKPSTRPSTRRTRLPTKRRTKKPSARPRRPTRIPSRQPSIRRRSFSSLSNNVVRRRDSVHSNNYKVTDTPYTKIDLLVNLLQNMDMVVSDQVHHGQRKLLRSIHYKNNNTFDDIVSDVWISDIVLSHDIPSPTKGTTTARATTEKDDEIKMPAKREWYLLDSNTHSTYSYYHPLYNSNNPFIFQSDLRSMISGSRFNENNSIENDNRRMNEIEQVRKQMKSLEEKLEQMKSLEEKLERITQLLERVL